MSVTINYPIPTQFAFEPIDDTTLRAIEYHLIRACPDVSFDVKWHSPGLNTEYSVWYLDLVFENEHDATVFALKYHEPLDIVKWVNDL